jgi:hypothetical protein
VVITLQYVIQMQPWAASGGSSVPVEMCQQVAFDADWHADIAARQHPGIPRERILKYAVIWEIAKRGKAIANSGPDPARIRTAVEKARKITERALVDAHKFSECIGRVSGDIPQDIREKIPDQLLPLQTLQKALDTWTPAPAEGPERHTVLGDTIVNWLVQIEDYPGKRRHMHALAMTWGLTSSNYEVFSQSVSRYLRAVELKRAVEVKRWYPEEVFLRPSVPTHESERDFVRRMIRQFIWT